MNKAKPMADILLIEDNRELSELLTVFLEKDGYCVTVFNTGEEAAAYLEEEKVKLVLLDIMLPGMDGFAVCSAIRRISDVPVIILSARTDKEDKMNGFLLGADDYVEKPVDPDILRAKVGALMRRSYEWKQHSRMLYSGALSVDTDRYQAFLHKEQISLTQKEFELLLLFLKNPGKTLSKEFLFAKIWGMDSFSENQTLTVHIKTLRDKIEENPREPRRIRTVWGVGYQYEEI